MDRARRLIMLGLAASGALPARLAAATTAIGQVTDVTGAGILDHAGAQSPLAIGAAIHDGDRVRTGPAALAALVLRTDTRINLGTDSDLTVERYLADIGGTLTIGGAMAFDRPEGLPPLDLTVVTAFGAIGVRGTRFFAGPSRGAFAVFVQRGSVAITASGTRITLGPGEGVDLGRPATRGLVPPASPGASGGSAAVPPSVVRWGDARIADALASVGLTP